MIDVLEEEPSTAGEGWRKMAATSGSDNMESERLARRTTFGLITYPRYVHQPDFVSEQASLYSMRSNLNLSPASPPRSTGSAPAPTRQDPSHGSNSSRPSTASSSGAISYARSLARTESITSDGRRRGVFSDLVQSHPLFPLSGTTFALEVGAVVVVRVVALLCCRVQVRLILPLRGMLGAIARLHR